MIDSVLRDPFEPARSAPPLILPDPARIFLDRSRRFAALAEGHPLADWLDFMRRISEAQHKVLQEYPDFAGSREADPAGISSMPPIMASSRSRDPVWRQARTALARELESYAPSPARKTLEGLRHMDGTSLESLADRVLTGRPEGEGERALPFVAAALQVHWTALASRLDKKAIGPADAPGLCPCCGSPPVAGVVRIDGEVPGLRYLHCALCNTEWNLVRVTCVACGRNEGVAYHRVEGSDGSVRAETCDTCRSYLKMVYRDKSPQADPVADDLATLSLDLLVEEGGYHRVGPNLLLTPGMPLYRVNPA